MATVDVKDAAGSTVALEKPLAPGRAAAAASKPVVLSTEDLAALGALTETVPATDTASSGLNGRLQRLAQRLTSLIALLPSALVGGRLSVTPAMASGGVIAVSTPVAGGSGYQAAGSQACTYIMVSNPGTVALRVQLGGAGEYLTLAAGQAMPLHGLSNTSAVGVKRADESATQVRLEIHWAA